MSPASRRLWLSQQQPEAAGVGARPGFGPVVLDANFRLAVGDPAAIAAQADTYLQHRRRTQPDEPSLGSTFRNPPGDYAGRLIEAAGLKGARVGGVEVSQLPRQLPDQPGRRGRRHGGRRDGADPPCSTDGAGPLWRDLEPEVQLAGEWPNERLER